MTAVGASGEGRAGLAGSGEVPESGGAFRLDAWRRPMGPLAEGSWAGVVVGHGGASSSGRHLKPAWGFSSCGMWFQFCMQLALVPWCPSSWGKKTC